MSQRPTISTTGTKTRAARIFPRPEACAQSKETLGAPERIASPVLHEAPRQPLQRGSRGAGGALATRRWLCGQLGWQKSSSSEQRRELDVEGKLPLTRGLHGSHIREMSIFSPAYCPCLSILLRAALG